MFVLVLPVVAYSKLWNVIVYRSDEIQYTGILQLKENYFCYRLSRIYEFCYLKELEILLAHSV